MECMWWDSSLNGLEDSMRILQTQWYQEQLPGKDFVFVVLVPGAYGARYMSPPPKKKRYLPAG